MLIIEIAAMYSGRLYLINSICAPRVGGVIWQIGASGSIAASGLLSSDITHLKA